VYLSAQELIELTSRRRPRWQAKQLSHMGIPYRERTDGTLAVLRIHAETVEAQSGATLSKEPRLNLDL